MAKANVVKKEESQLPALSLDLMEGDAHSGLENISQDDLATPRLKVLMQLSPIVGVVTSLSISSNKLLINFSSLK